MPNNIDIHWHPEELNLKPLYIGKIIIRWWIGNGRGRPVATFIALTFHRRACASNGFFHVGKVYELVRLTAQFIGHHRWLCIHRGHNADALSAMLQCLDQGSEVTIATKQYYVV
jgi:hypothetical protein